MRQLWVRNVWSPGILQLSNKFTLTKPSPSYIFEMDSSFFLNLGCFFFFCLFSSLIGLTITTLNFAGFVYKHLLKSSHQICRHHAQAYYSPMFLLFMRVLTDNRRWSETRTPRHLPENQAASTCAGPSSSQLSAKSRLLPCFHILHLQDTMPGRNTALCSSSMQACSLLSL